MTLERRLVEADGRPLTRRMQAGGVIVNYIIAMPDTEAAHADSIATSMENLNLAAVSSIVESRLIDAGFTTMAPSATGVTSQVVTQAPTEAPTTPVQPSRRPSTSFLSFEDSGASEQTC